MYTVDELKSFVPKDNRDGDRLTMFDGLTDGEILPVICDILCWTADMNWSVAEKCRNIVISHQNAAMPFIHGVLSGKISLEHGEDKEWQYFIITEIVSGLTPENRKVIKNELVRISKFSEQEYSETAKDALKEYY